MMLDVLRFIADAIVCVLAVAFIYELLKKRFK